MGSNAINKKRILSFLAICVLLVAIVPLLSACSKNKDNSHDLDKDGAVAVTYNIDAVENIETIANAMKNAMTTGHYSLVTIWTSIEHGGRIFAQAPLENHGSTYKNHTWVAVLDQIAEQYGLSQGMIETIAPARK
jgi:hypothetical protein